MGQARMTLSVVIAAYNEAPRIGPILQEVRDRADEVLVVDDGSTDGTADVARTAGARVLILERNLGYPAAVVRGLREASGDVLVTLDADGEHDASLLDRIVHPIRDGEADLVLGVRSTLPRWSERLLASLSRLAVPTQDPSTGYRAMRADLVERMGFRGACLCGTLLLEAVRMGARVVEVPLPTRSVDKTRRPLWHHALQVFHVLRMVPGARREVRTGRFAGTQVEAGKRT